MRQSINYPKRIAEQTERIRRIAETLPAGKRNTLLNACGTIELHTRRYEPTENYPTGQQQHDAIRDRANATRRIFAALLSKRTLSYRDAAEFHTSEFHTRIVDVRHLIEERHPEYTLKSSWAADGRYKLYWLENTQII